MDPVFIPAFSYVSEAYAKDAEEEIHNLFDSAINDLEGSYRLIEEVIDVKDSLDYKNGSFTGFTTNDSVFSFEEGEEPSVAGSLKKACQISDALILQYYEEPDSKKAAFGHELMDEDWETISGIKDVYQDALFTAPSVAINVAHPLLQEMKSELSTDGRQFTFLCGHDSNLGSVLSALDAEPYSLPDTIEKKTPIGSKIVICRWKDSTGKDLMTIDLVYQKTGQLRDMSLLDIDNAPGIYSLRFNGLKADENGMYNTQDILDRFSDAIDAYDTMIEKNEAKEAA